MKRRMVLGIIFILLFSVISVEAFIKRDLEGISEAQLLIKGFETSKTEFVEFNVNTTLHLPNTFMSMDEMESIKEELMKKLELKGNIKLITEEEYFDPYFIGVNELAEDVIYIHKNQESGYNQITVTAFEKEGNMTVFILYSSEIEKEEESHIIIDMVRNKEYKEIEAIIMQHKEILSNYGSKVENTVTIVGAREGRVSEIENAKWLNGIIKSMKAKKIEEIVDSAFTSITLYTQELNKFIEYDYKKVNLQIASRYNQYENKTRVYIATPLITNTY